MVWLISFWCYFEARLGGFWKHFGVMLRSKIVFEAPWTLHSSQTSISTPFPHQNSGHFGRFWRAFGKVFGIILVCFVDIDFTMNFYMILRQFLMDFDTLSTSKIKQKAWRVVQKSTLHLICYGMSMDIDLGRILGSGWEQFWFPIGLQKRLRMQVLYSMLSEKGRV